MEQVIASRYRVLGEIGRGNMGIVYRVEHQHTGDRLALKLMHAHFGANDELVERFKREARAAARIKSEHVVRIIDADIAPELNDAPFLVMELLDGSDLAHLVASRGPLSPPEVAYLMAQAATALDRAHALGIVHRDLKPENLFVHRREDGTTVLKIVDFGISKVVGPDGVGTSGKGAMTQTGAVMGTPLYMAPEQARGNVSQIGPTTDVWALGLTVVTLLTGETYWTAETIPLLMVQILTEPMYNPSMRWRWLPPAFDAWFARSCDREPHRRWASVGEQVAELTRALASAQGGVIGPPSRPAPVGTLVPVATPTPAPASSATAASLLSQLHEHDRPPAPKRKLALSALVVAAVIAATVAAQAVDRRAHLALEPGPPLASIERSFGRLPPMLHPLSGLQGAPPSATAPLPAPPPDLSAPPAAGRRTRRAPPRPVPSPQPPALQAPTPWDDTGAEAPLPPDPSNPYDDPSLFSPESSGERGGGPGDAGSSPYGP